MSHTWKEGFSSGGIVCKKHGLVEWVPAPPSKYGMCGICYDEGEKSMEGERMVPRYPGQERDDGWTQRIELAKRASEMQQGTTEFKKLEEEFANVSAPPHYRFRGGLQTIDLIHEVLEKQQDGFLAYCLGNVFKYLTRYGRKDGLRDLKKALQYLAWAVEHVEKGSISHE